MAEGDRSLFEAPRVWRAETGPASIAQLDGITGIGEKKREAYGDAVLAVVAANGAALNGRSSRFAFVVVRLIVTSGDKC